MKSFLVTVPIVSAKGYQQFTVDALDGKDALKKFKAGECEFAGEEIEVTDLRKPEIELNE